METKKVKVIMLPVKYGNIYNQKSMDKSLKYKPNSIIKTDKLNTACHLYFLSDEEIKEGDWYVYNAANDSKNPKWEIHQCKTITNDSLVHYIDNHLTMWCKKIIATTNKLTIKDENDTYDPRSKTGFEPFDLPRPTADFIKAYVKADGIDEVLVEYETLDENRIWTSKEMEKYPKLKVNSYNEITIHSIKDCYSKEEVIALIRKYHNKYNRGMSFDRNPYQIWLKENLK